MHKPLQDILVVDFSQFLSGPSASLRLADMGARVIKIEKPQGGDICRELYVSDVRIDDESTIFHAINRNKESFSADLKNAEDLEQVKELLKKADVLIHNFRPGVMNRLGLDYPTVQALNPAIIYAEISGYGYTGPLHQLPGQDLLLQALSGLCWLSNDQDEQPTPMGVAVVDILAGTHLAQGILALLYQTISSGQGALVQVSMFESALDFQFEVLTCYYNDGYCLPQRSAINSAHAYIAAPYGIYQTTDHYVAIAMTDIVALGRMLNLPALEGFENQDDWFARRDEIKTILANALKTQTAAHWLSILEPAGVWCAPVFDFDMLVKSEPYRMVEMEMTVTTTNGMQVKTTRCPIQIDGKKLLSTQGAPALGENTLSIQQEFNLLPAAATHKV